MADKYSADVDRVVERAIFLLAQESSDSEQLARRQHQFEAQLVQHEMVVQQKAAKLKFLVELHANELTDTISEIRDASVEKYNEARSSMDQRRRLTDDLRRYAVEVSFSHVFCQYRTVVVLCGYGGQQCLCLVCLCAYMIINGPP